MKPLLSMLLALAGLAALSGRCNAQYLPFDDPFNNYLQRSVTITLGAGNAKDANAAIHTIDPWPPYVGRIRIPGRGRHAVESIERLNRNPDPFIRQSGATGAAGADTPAAAGSNLGTLNLGSTPPTPMQPISGGY
jgi:hypothetical protein